MTLKISDITKFTLQDFPNHTACIVWFAGCNMRCKYCHNAEFLEQNHDFLDEKEVFDLLKKRIGLFDGVVLSGGECTLNEEIIPFIKKIKDLGFKVKIDTNGLNYDLVKQLVDNKNIDFVALDFKAPFDKFSNVTQISTSMYGLFDKTLNFLIENNNKKNVDLEIRTTVHTALLQENDLNRIIDLLDNLNYKQEYFIQNFRNDNKRTLVDLGEQPYILDKEKIKTPKNFKVGFRNFF